MSFLYLNLNESAIKSYETLTDQNVVGVYNEKNKKQNRNSDFDFDLILQCTSEEHEDSGNDPNVAFRTVS